MNRLMPGGRIRFLIILLLLIVSTNACINWGQSSITPTPNQSSQLSVPSVRNVWAEALAVAQKWHTDAYVYNVSFDFTLPTISPANKVIFSFQSPSENYATLQVPCSISRCSSFEVEREPEAPVTYCRPITLDDFMLDSTDALNIGLQNGGEHYTQLQVALVFLLLYRANPSCTGPVEWSISFLDPYASTGTDIAIDATTGEIVGVDGWGE